MTYLRVELLIEGPEEVLNDIERETGLRRAPYLSEFSLERLVPFPYDKLASQVAQAGIAERLRDEVLNPFRKIAEEEHIGEAQRKTMEYDLACIVIRTCSGVSRVSGFPDVNAGGRWRRGNWGCDWDLESNAPQRPLSEENPEQIHVLLLFTADNGSPPLTAFDALAARWPAIEMTVAWDGGGQAVAPCGTGLATWIHGVRESMLACSDRDRSEGYGRVHSLAPLRLARQLRDSALPTTECAPSLRIDLTEDEYRELEGKGSVELEAGPDHTVTVGCGVYDDFMSLGHRLGGYDYCDLRGIEYDEVWHRMPGEILGMKVSLSLHSTDAVDVNRAETILMQGSDPILDWVRESGAL